MKKNDYFVAKAIDYTEDGLGVVKYNDFTYFVKGIIRNEKANLKVLNEKKTYGYAKIEELLDKSNKRRETTCPYYPKCGGCQIMHLNQEEQAYFKTQKVLNCLRRIGKLDLSVKPIISSKNEFKYRNKVQVPFENNKAGFYRSNSHDIVEIDKCLLQSDLANEIYDYLVKIIKKNNYHDIRHILLKHAFKTNEVMICLVSRTYNLKDIDKAVNEIVSEFPMVKTIVINLNQDETNVILGKNNKIIHGNGYIVDELLNVKFRISVNSFYQVNHDQCEILYQKAFEFADLKKNDVVADIYGGIGTIGLCASYYCQKVFGIEIIPQAVVDAKENAKINNITNVEYECADAAEATTKWVRDNLKIDVVFVDPPRKGLDGKTIESLITLKPKKIIYISCDPATLARDLQILNNNYEIKEVQPVDMFPNTSHVECVVGLQKK